MEVDPGLGDRFQRREEAALEEVVRRLGPALLTYLRRYVSRDEAEDVLQQTLLDAWRSAERYDPAQRFTGWLFTIAHRRAVDAARLAVPLGTVKARAARGTRRLGALLRSTYAAERGA